MKKNNYDGRRSLFWVVTFMAGLGVGREILILWHSGFQHPVIAVAEILAAVGIWFSYSMIVRQFRVSRIQITNELANVEVWAAMCCLLGFTLALGR